SARVTFSSAVLVAEACPTRWSLATAGDLLLRMCARVEGGERTTAGQDIPGARSVTRAWLAVAPAAYLRVRLARSFFLELGGNLLFPLIRDRVYLAPDITVHEVPPVGAGADLGAGVEFL